MKSLNPWSESCPTILWAIASVGYSRTCGIVPGLSFSPLATRVEAVMYRSREAAVSEKNQGPSHSEPLHAGMPSSSHNYLRTISSTSRIILFQ
jgi:hypothetical protein